MTYCKHCLACVALCLIGISLQPTQTVLAQTGPASPADAIQFPSPAKVDEAVTQYLEALTVRGESDLLSRRDVTPLFDVLGEIGWEVSPKVQAELESLLLDDSDWLVRTLRTRKGTRFMREMSTFPGGYDRLDRMRQQPQGKKELQGLIESPGGAKLIEYLTTTKQGRNTGAQIPGGRGGAKFNTPTHRLYTKDDVAKHVKLAYAAEAARRLQATSLHSTRTPSGHSPEQSGPPLSEEPTPGESPFGPVEQ